MITVETDMIMMISLTFFSIYKMKIPARLLRYGQKSALLLLAVATSGRGMLHKLAWIVLLLMLKADTLTAVGELTDFLFNGFMNGSVNVNGEAQVEPSGVLRLTSFTDEEVGHGYYPTPFSFLNSSGQPFSFSTSFIFAIVSHYSGTSSEGLAFAITPSFNYTPDIPSQFLGLYDTKHFVAVKFDTVLNRELHETGYNDVGINVDDLVAVTSAPASFVSGASPKKNLSLISGQPIRAWAEYDSNTMRFNVTVAPFDVPKPESPLLSAIVNLSSVFSGDVYVGFSASTGLAGGSHKILGWSFSLNGKERELVLSEIPSLSSQVEGPPSKRRRRNGILIWAPLGAVILLTVALGFVVFMWRTWRRSAALADEWETAFGPQRFSYRDLHKATRGFSRENLLGSGGFGEVYKGVLSKSNQEVAVKRISHDSRQGMKEFLAELASIGRLRHRNLVQLLGYARRRRTLVLVYDFMLKGSLDKYLFYRGEETLSWKQRFKIIKDIAAGLLYLHEEWDQVVLHRDIKASNILLDADFNGKLGDFGLAKLQDRGSLTPTTRIIGTLGYVAPEISRTGKCTTSSDVFAYGAFLLEIVCAKRPVELRMTGVEFVLVDWIIEFFKRGELVEARDRRLMMGDFSEEEVELVLKLGLMCSSPAAAARPSMKQVLQHLEKETVLPEMTPEFFNMFAARDEYSAGDGSVTGISIEVEPAPVLNT